MDFERFALRLRAGALDFDGEERREARRSHAEAFGNSHPVRIARTHDAPRCGCGHNYTDALTEFCPVCDGGNERESVCGSTLP
jgi:hypothetical protein